MGSRTCIFKKEMKGGKQKQAIYGNKKQILYSNRRCSSVLGMNYCVVSSD